MGFELKVEGGPGSIELGYETITSVKYFSDSPAGEFPAGGRFPPEIGNGPPGGSCEL